MIDLRRNAYSRTMQQMAPRQTVRDARTTMVGPSLWGRASSLPLQTRSGRENATTKSDTLQSTLRPLQCDAFVATSCLRVFVVATVR